MPASALATLEYKAWRKKYRNLIVSARRQMTTELQKQLLDAIAGASFQAGFAAGRNAPPKKLELHPWTKQAKREPQ